MKASAGPGSAVGGASLRTHQPLRADQEGLHLLRVPHPARGPDGREVPGGSGARTWLRPLKEHQSCSLSPPEEAGGAAGGGEVKGRPSTLLLPHLLRPYQSGGDG